MKAPKSFLVSESGTVQASYAARRGLPEFCVTFDAIPGTCRPSRGKKSIQEAYCDLIVEVVPERESDARSDGGAPKPSVAVCRICFKLVSTKSANFVSHLKHMHPEFVCKDDREDKSIPAESDEGMFHRYVALFVLLCS